MYEPKTIDELCGETQRNVAKLLIEGDVRNLVFLSGDTGTGKTTIAKMYAERLESDYQHVYCREVGVDYIRNVVIGSFNIAPSFGNKYTVFFLDEVDNLSDAGQSALLQVENIPEHVVLIFSTLHPTKVRKDLLGRCDKFHLPQPSLGEVKNFMVQVFRHYEISFGSDTSDITPEVAKRVYEDSRGSLRELVRLISLHKDGSYTPQEEEQGLAPSIVKLLLNKAPVAEVLAVEVADYYSTALGISRYALSMIKNGKDVVHLFNCFSNWNDNLEPDIVFARMVLDYYGGLV